MACTIEQSEKIEPLYVAIGQRVLEERIKAGWTQQDLCGQVRLERSSIANIELGRQRVMLHQIFDLAEVLSIPLDDLLGVSIQAARDDDDKKALRGQIIKLRRRVAELETALRGISSKALDAAGSDN